MNYLYKLASLTSQIKARIKKVKILRGYKIEETEERGTIYYQ